VSSHRERGEGKVSESERGGKKRGYLSPKTVLEKSLERRKEKGEEVSFATRMKGKKGVLLRDFGEWNTTRKGGCAAERSTFV